MSDEKLAGAGGMIYRLLGKTGERVSAIGFGGSHIGAVADDSESIAIMHAAIDAGINFFDNCWDYHNGRSELQMGKALSPGYRDRVFLMTKIDGRDARSAAKQIDQSLIRLQTDYLDLLEFHEVIRFSDPDKIFAAAGAIEAVRAAKKAGKIRYIGFSGHKSPEFHLKMLETAKRHEFVFDAVQMPLNVLDAHYDSFEKLVLPRLIENEIGVVGMKPLGAGSIVESRLASGIESLHYALSLPTSVVITGIDSMEHLQQALEAVRTLSQFGDSERRSLLARLAPFGRIGKFEEYKTSNRHDGTSRHPEWLGAA